LPIGSYTIQVGKGKSAKVGVISFELLTADLATAARARPLVEPSPAIPPRQHLLALWAMPPHLEESPRTEKGYRHQHARADRKDDPLKSIKNISKHGSSRLISSLPPPADGPRCGTRDSRSMIPIRRFFMRSFLRLAFCCGSGFAWRSASAVTR